jgi:hypothetical protein
MKATIDIDEGLYRRLKIEAARRGQTIRELVAEGLRLVLLGTRSVTPAPGEQQPPWFGSLRRYARNANGRHDLAAMRRSIARVCARP